MPRAADKISETLNIPVTDNWNNTQEPLPVGHGINKPKPLFKKIEDKIIEEEKQKLYENLKTEEENEETNEMISIDYFDKVEIRIGQIKEAEKIEKSNKLLKLQVDIGDKTVQIVAGLAKRYSPEELIDKKVTVLVNLEPAKLFGVESQGMLLASGESAALLVPEEPVNVGEEIQ